MPNKFPKLSLETITQKVLKPTLSPIILDSYYEAITNWDIIVAINQ